MSDYFKKAFATLQLYFMLAALLVCGLSLSSNGKRFCLTYFCRVIKLPIQWAQCWFSGLAISNAKI